MSYEPLDGAGCHTPGVAGMVSLSPTLTFHLASQTPHHMTPPVSHMTNVTFVTYSVF